MAMQGRQQLKVLIADDHKMFGDALRNLLMNYFHSVSQVSDGHELLYAVRKDPPDLLILDINLPGVNGFEAAVQIRKSYPKIRIVVVTMYNQLRMLKQAQELGLDGYLLKDSPSQLLLTAIETILNGGVFYDPKVVRSMTRKDDFSDEYVLTQREKQIISGLLKGKKAREIAEELGLKYETVKSHRKNIYLKLEIGTLLELVDKFKDTRWDGPEQFMKI